MTPWRPRRVAAELVLRDYRHMARYYEIITGEMGKQSGILQKTHTDMGTDALIEMRMLHIEFIST